MKTPLLDYYKIILTKVSFDDALLIQEYKKAIKYLNTVEIEDLHLWLINQEKFRPLKDVINLPLKKVAGKKQYHAGYSPLAKSSQSVSNKQNSAY